MPIRERIPLHHLGGRLSVLINTPESPAPIAVHTGHAAGLDIPEARVYPPEDIATGQSSNLSFIVIAITPVNK